VTTRKPCCSALDARRRAVYVRGLGAPARSVQRRQEDTLIPGTFYEFSGPLHDQGGRLRVPAGEKLSVSDLYAFKRLVKGVIGGPKG
jgi:hypothetical protein